MAVTEGIYSTALYLGFVLGFTLEMLIIMATVKNFIIAADIATRTRISGNLASAFTTSITSDYADISVNTIKSKIIGINTLFPDLPYVITSFSESFGFYIPSLIPFDPANYFSLENLSEGKCSKMLSHWKSYIIAKIKFYRAKILIKNENGNFSIEVEERTW